MSNSTDTIAIMQPYYFPYQGYFRLLLASNHFIFLDDVNFIKRGFIHRNSILLDGAPYRFSIPLEKPSQNKLITQTHPKDLLKFKDEFLTQIHYAYYKSRYYDEVRDLITKSLSDHESTIAEVAAKSIMLVSEYLNLNKTFSFSSAHSNQDLKGVDRILDLLKLNDCNDYVNLPGGRNLYSEEQFKTEGINLKFIEKSSTLNHLSNPYELSIIDTLMNYGLDSVSIIYERYLVS